MPNDRTLVAIFNSSSDVRALLQEAVEEAGFRTVLAHVPEIKRGQHDFVAFIEDQAPRVIVYDVGPPYEENWTFLKLVQNTQVSDGVPFVVTSTNKQALEGLVGETTAIELIGKTEDLDAIISAVRAAIAPEADAA